MTGCGARFAAGAPVLSVCFLLLSAPAFAQPVQQETEGGRKAGTYLVGGVAHWQSNIFSPSKLTQWKLDLFGPDYNLTSINVAIESYFGDTFLVSGFSIGYRKDVIRRADSGHMFSLSLFRDFDCTLFAVKVGGGAEWGMPSLNFDRTEFNVAQDGAIRYRHTYPERNADVPGFGTTTDGSLYPFFELSAVQRPGAFFAEAGIRLNIIGFNFDGYEVTASDKVQYFFQKQKTLVPYLFVNLGFRM